MEMQKTSYIRVDEWMDSHGLKLCRLQSEALNLADNLEQSVQRTLADYRRLLKSRESQED